MDVLNAASASTTVEAEVRRIRELIGAGRHDAACQACSVLLTRVPENRDVLYMKAVSERYLGRIAAALDTLAAVESFHPTYSRLFQERGHCFIAAREPAAALEAYLQAVNLNAALPASWHALRILFKSARRAEEAEMAAGHVAKLASLPPEIVTASSLFFDGEEIEAERIVRAFLKDEPTHVEGMRLLARIGMKLGVLDDAEFLLESVLTFSPGYQPARYDFVRVLLQRHRHQRALEESRLLLAAEPGNRDYRAVYAASCLALADYDEALATYRALVAENPHAADLHLSIGHALKTLGRQSEAIEAYRRAADVQPSFGDAYWSLANLKTYRFDESVIARMQAEEGRAEVSLNDRAHLCFAIGKALEDGGRFEESFGFYERGNLIKKEELGYRPATIERNAARQIAFFTPEFIASRAGVGFDCPDPIFIVGLPRAGSTLLEQILASHPEVEGTMELADISRLVVRLQGRDHDEDASRYPGLLAELPAKAFAEFGARYIKETEIYRSGRRFFIDKNPNNFRHLGLIHLILPRAKIIDARREPMACCFSNFKQLFAAGQDFTYGLEEIGRYYRSYLGLMAHWNRVLPGRILHVQHEDVVDDLEASVRRLLNFCGLEFDQRCLEFHKTERSVRTASSEQVRRPIFRDGLDQWRNFEPWLGKLREVLDA